jgi:hypothetical protein
MRNEKYSIVLVIRLNTHHEGKLFDNLERFMRIGMISYEKYLVKEDIQDFFVVCPKKDIGYIRDKLQLTHPNFPWRFIDEDTLLYKGIPSGWAKQQTVKMAISKLIQTPTYLIIDDDTYLTKPFHASDIYYKDRVIMNKTMIDFPMFFLWSSQIAKVDYDEVQSQPFHMAITPEIFVTLAVKDLVKWLEMTYGANMKWQEFLCNHKYTEYCLYWIFLLKHKRTTMLYAVEEDAPSVYGNACTGAEHDLETQVRLSFQKNEKYWFSFVQSSLPYDVNKVEEVFKKYI